jgi:hypothetical protein
MVGFVKGKVEGMKIKWCRGLINESEDSVAFIAIE